MNNQFDLEFLSIKQEVNDIINESEMYAGSEIKQESSDFDDIIEVDIGTCSTKNSVMPTDVKEDIQNLRRNQEYMLARLEEISKRQEELAEMILENNNILTRKTGVRYSKNISRFPLMTEKDLVQLNALLKGNQKAEIVTIMENILSVGGLGPNINRILDPSLIIEFNYDGAKGKKSLKEYQAFTDALFEASYVDGQTENSFLKELRASFKAQKNRFYKMVSRQKYQTTNEEPVGALDD